MRALVYVRVSISECILRIYPENSRYRRWWLHKAREHGRRNNNKQLLISRLLFADHHRRRYPNTAVCARKPESVLYTHIYIHAPAVSFSASTFQTTRSGNGVGTFILFPRRRPCAVQPERPDYLLSTVSNTYLEQSTAVIYGITRTRTIYL